MAVRFNINNAKITERLNNPFGKDGMAMLASQILKDCNEYCKWDTGMLVDSSLIHSKLEQGLLIWQTPYAARQYYEIKTAITSDGHPKATWRWCEVAKGVYKNDWGRQAQEIARKYG